MWLTFCAGQCCLGVTIACNLLGSPSQSLTHAPIAVVLAGSISWMNCCIKFVPVLADVVGSAELTSTVVLLVGKADPDSDPVG